MKNKLYIYLVVINILSIIACNQYSNILSVQQTEFIKLGPVNKEKELTVKFPFAVSKKDNLDSWRCTSDQPYCITYANDSLEIGICHIYYNPKFSYLSKDSTELRASLNHRVEEGMADDSKMLPELLNTKKSISKIEICNQFQHTQYGYVLRWPGTYLYKSEYTWINEAEFLSVEFSQISNDELDNSYLHKEIEFIIDRIEWKPLCDQF